ncbi:MAG: hypothetical protein IKU07_09440 [Oscillospiraceae bacterium]|nr:hypothetical protein [Oscillospiraceae bacterium]
MKIILILVDGMRPDALEHIPVAHLENLTIAKHQSTSPTPDWERNAIL